MNDTHFMGWLGRWSGAGAALGAALGLCLGTGSPLRAQEAVPSVSTTGATHSVALEYREVPYPVHTLGLEIAFQNNPFAKEPNWGGRKILRGTIKFGNSTGQFLPFAWDPTRSKLYLDLNRNRDLTDDAAGVLSADKGPTYSRNDYYSQTFPKLPLDFKTALGAHRALVNLGLYNYGTYSGGSLSCRSFWEGKMTLQGREWQVGFIERNVVPKPGLAGDGYLLLRPWEARKDSFSVDSGLLEAFEFSRNLFFGNQGYRVDCAYVSQGGGPGYQLDLKEQPVRVGELKLSGKFIQRLLLTGQGGKAPFTVVLDQPEPVARIPVGTYQHRVCLRAGNTQAHRDEGRGGRFTGAVVTVNTAQAASLRTGGPLTNTVSANRRGRDLSLNYRLAGADGSDYQLFGARQQPEFAVYKADKKLASGKFEFG